MRGFVIGWALGLIFGGATLLRRCVRAQLSRSQAVAIVLSLVFCVIVGTKLLYLAEAWWVGIWPASSLYDLVVSPRMKIPGGILLALLICWPLGWLCHLRPLWISEELMAIPASICLIAVRTGCLLEGCCHGTPTDLPWAITFPPGSSAFEWQSGMSLIDDLAPYSLPVHPLQVYYAGIGVVLSLGLTWRLRRSQYEGQTAFWFVMVYFGSTWALDFLSSVPNPVTRLLCATVILITFSLRMRLLTLQRGSKRLA